MQALKRMFAILLVVGLVTWVAKWKESLQQRLPARFADKIRAGVRVVAGNVLASYSINNQNPLVSLLKLTEDDAYLTNLRQLLTDEELADMTRVNVAALAMAVKTEQNKAFQRVAYFLPARMGQEAYSQWFFPETRIAGVATAEILPNSGNGGTRSGTRSGTRFLDSEQQRRAALTRQLVAPGLLQSHAGHLAHPGHTGHSAQSEQREQASSQASQVSGQPAQPGQPRYFVPPYSHSGSAVPFANAGYLVPGPPVQFYPSGLPAYQPPLYTAPVGYSSGVQEQRDSPASESSPEHYRPVVIPRSPQRTLGSSPVFRPGASTTKTVLSKHTSKLRSPFPRVAKRSSLSRKKRGKS